MNPDAKEIRMDLIRSILGHNVYVKYHYVSLHVCKSGTCPKKITYSVLEELPLTPFTFHL